MTSDNSKSQIPRLFRSQKYENLNLSFKTFEIQFKIWDLRLYYSTVQLLYVLFCVPFCSLYWRMIFLKLKASGKIVVLLKIEAEKRSSRPLWANGCFWTIFKSPKTSRPALGNPDDVDI